MKKRYPVSISFDLYPSTLLKIPISTMMSDYKIAFEAYKKTNEYFDLDGGCGSFIPGVICKDFGGEMEFPQWNLPLITRFPINSPADIEALILPQVEKTFSYKYNRGILELCSEDGQLPGIYLSSVMERASHLMGTTELLRMMRKSPKTVHLLMDKITEYTLREAEHYYNLYTHSDFWVAFAYSIESQSLISPKDFYEFCAPYIIRLHRELEKMGISNFSESLCGNHSRTLEFWKDGLKLPVGTSVTVDSCMDFPYVSDFFGENFVLHGSVSHKILQYGSEAEVYSTSIEFIKRFHARKGGFVLSPDSGLPYSTPECNVFALLEAAEACIYLA